jgi:hypothetical protein
MKIILFSIRMALALAVVLGSFSFNPVPARAWEQGASGTHEQINRQAVKRFFNSMSGNAKYENSPVDKTQAYLATRITSSSLMTTGLTTAQADQTFEGWLADGGFSADEPNLWASVRHFYDPLSINGVPQLTDHNWFHGQVYDAISARKWAFEDADNPFNWRKALEYYKKSMEIPEDNKEIMVPGFEFRDSTIQIKSAEDARNIYLGKAFRSLGESMHMIADLTQPCHVRNDSHPFVDSDPIESTANFNTVLLVKDAPVDPTASADIAASANAEDMYVKLALWTNRNFYTDDTIYDKASGTKPWNSEGAYPHPQFSDLVLENTSGPKIYYKVFNGKNVRMVQQTYSSWVLGESVWAEYSVPSKFVNGQAEVLMPIAIRAGAKLINLFFPTMELAIDVKPNTAQSADPNLKEFAITSPFKHNSGDDPDWQKAGLSIQYSGPGELWVETAGKERKLGNLSYKQGALEKPVAVFVGDKSKAKADLYQVNDKDNIFIKVNAGGRAFKSNKYTISAQSDLSISPSEITLEIGAKQKFTAKVNIMPANSSLEWIVDGKSMGKSAATEFQIGFATAGRHAVQVQLYSADKLLKTAEATVEVKAASPTPSVTPSPTPTASQIQLGRLQQLQTTIRMSFGINCKIIAGSSGLSDGTFGSIPITWQAAAFSGTKKDGTINYSINGQFSADGKTLQRMKLQRILSSGMEEIFEVSNLPFESPFTVTGCSYQLKGADITKYLIRADFLTATKEVNMSLKNLNFAEGILSLDFYVK